ncbi:thioesterase domain-containing protein [Paraburkholderia sp. BL8N3]|nr:alpha/beta fold hydrolase [Paraburkholderia sp. BL8N3]TCK33806.1 thioesterase domain-containing protein [Paraburkholderia sp. BL8N3]
MTLLADLIPPASTTGHATPTRARTNAPVARTLFLLHDYTGLDDGIAELAAHLAADGPLHMLRCPPLPATEPATMEGLAALHVETILRLQPEGPYRLAGWSFGGILAYEIAMQLVGRDHVVEFLGVIDASLPPSDFERRIARTAATQPGSYLLGLMRLAAGVAPSGDTRHRELRRLFAPGNTAARAARVAMLDSLPELLLADPALADVINACRRAGAWPEALASMSDAALATLLARWRAHDHALAHYAPFPTSTFVHLFRPHAPNSADSEPRDRAQLWEGVLRNGQYHFVPNPAGDAPFLDASAEALARTITRALRDDLQRRGSRVAATPETDYSPHIPIRQGGSRKEPILLVPGAGSAVTAFMPFCNLLDDEWEAHGLQPRGFDGVMAPHSSVEAAARSYLAQIDLLAAAGRTSVHIVGHSFGGWIAFQLACLLQARGTPPASLTVIDSEAPESNGKLGRAYTFSEVSWNLVRALELGTGKTMGIERDAYFGAERDHQWEMLRRGMRELHLIHRRSGHADLHGLVRTYATALRTVYRPPGRYLGPATLVLAADEAASNRDALEGWLRFVPSMTERRCNGNHYTMLQGPHVEGLARWWQARH